MGDGDSRRPPNQAPWIAGPRRRGRASSSDPETWNSFDSAVASVWSDGVGYVFAAADPYIGIDLDDCRDPATGELASWAERRIDRIDTYTEVSPSGTGVHLIAHGHVPGPRRRRGPVEMYDSGRYFTITGNILGQARDDRAAAAGHRPFVRSRCSTSPLAIAPLVVLVDTTTMTSCCSSGRDPPVTETGSSLGGWPVAAVRLPVAIRGGSRALQPARILGGWEISIALTACSARAV